MPVHRTGRPAGAPARDLYAEVTDRIITALEAGVAPWAPSHTAGRAAAPLAWPRNGATGRPYAGLNVLLLWLAGHERGYASPAWYTFNQARALGACVRKSERGTLVTFWRELVRENKETREAERVPLLRHFVVFNAAQIDGLPEAPAGGPAEAAQPAWAGPLWERFAAAEALVWRHSVHVVEGAPRPCYRPATDTVHMPAVSAYADRGGYYGDLMHECVHWTGHPARLARPLGARGTPEYGREELVAELGAAFVCAALGITGRLTHAEYLGAWLTTLRADKRAIFAAAAAARRAAEYLTGTPAAPADEDDGGSPENDEAPGARALAGAPAGGGR